MTESKNKHKNINLDTKSTVSNSVNAEKISDEKNNNTVNVNEINGGNKRGKKDLW